VTYAIQVSNTGTATVTSNSIFILDALPPTLAVGTSASPSFSACTYTPTSAYDPAVKYVCINPKGTMAASTGSPPNFTVSFNAQIK